MKLFIASDHGGFDLKSKLLEKLNSSGFEITDLGPFELNEEDDYTDFAEKLSKNVQQSSDSKGILICRSGIGMSIAANKFKGVYAALCFNEKHAEMARRHNNANVLCLDSDYGDFEEHSKIVDKFFSTNFEKDEERHVRRTQKIKKFEE